MDQSESALLFERAKRSIPGGVNSPVRAFKSVGGIPLFMKHARGPYIWDANGNKYIDYVGSWGPFILGHSHPAVVEAIQRQAALATSFGAPTELEVELAELVRELIPSIELLRLVNSGTEATMSAIRLARGFTKREKIIKFEGCYHGHADAFLIKAGSGALTLGTPDSPGVTKSTAQDTLNAIYNDLPSVEALILANHANVAAIIVEPIAGNMGVVPPETGFLEGLRALCDAHGIVLIFDEVMTGFRVALGGAQSLFGVKPDLTTLGKIIGGGLPVGAFGGKQEIMSLLSPSGPVYQAGTLSGNPLATVAGLTTLRILREENPYPELQDRAAKLATEVEVIARQHGVQIFQTGVGSMICIFFTKGPVRDYASATSSDTTTYAKYFHTMLDAGIYIAPSQYEAMFISSAHTDLDFEKTVAAWKSAFAQLAA